MQLFGITRLLLIELGNEIPRNGWLLPTVFGTVLIYKPPEKVGL